jgi:hypothetical protein
MALVVMGHCRFIWICPLRQRNIEGDNFLATAAT